MVIKERQLNQTKGENMPLRKRKPKNELKKSPKRGHVGVEPEYHSRLMMLVKHYQQDDPKFSANKLVCGWVEQEERRIRAKSQLGSVGGLGPENP